jgi:hypothetical protein
LPELALISAMSQAETGALDWAKHEAEIRDLFISQNKTLDQVMAHMRRKYNFTATYEAPLSH